MEIKELAEKVLADLKDGVEIAEGIKAVKEAWASESNWMKKAFKAVRAGVDLISDVVERVETLGVDLQLAGDKKKELAVEVINRLIDLPYLPEAAEAVVISFAIDMIVAQLNRLAARKGLGKNWLALA
jgi:hypothetical protein